MQSSSRVTYSGEVAIVHVIGDLDVSTAPELRSRALTVIDDGWTNLLIDLTACAFMDSIGLGILIAILRRARSRGGDVEIQAPFEQQRRMFALCRLDSVFVVHAENLSETA
ncbi:MAG: STAS domain-containing protein [Acidimicrobiales bacterium]|nr:STAS domain-containing protein [Acidimicrobiales bacterium]